MTASFIDIKDIEGETTTVNVSIIGRVKPETVKPGFSPKKAYVYFTDGSGKLTVDIETYESVRAALIGAAKPAKKPAVRKTATASKD